MADLNPIGSEKLQGDEKLKRILELTYFDTDKKTITKNAELVSESASGVYGIVKEKDGYYVKKGLNESSLDYIGGMFMKNKNRFSSYAEAYKRLELLQGQELLNEDTRYLLKPKVNPAESAPKAPALDAPAPPMAQEPVPPSTSSVGDMAASSDPEAVTPDMTGEETPSDEFGGGMGGAELDPIKKIQKLTGKLGELINTHEEEIEPDDIKYVINSVLASFGDKLFSLDDTDKDEIFGKFEEDAEDMGDSQDFAPEDKESEAFDQEMNPDVSNDREMGEAMNSLEELINTPFDDDESEYDTDTMEPESEYYGDEAPTHGLDPNPANDIDWGFPDLEDDYYKGGEFDQLGQEEKFDDAEEVDEYDQMLRETLDQNIKQKLSKYFK